MQVYMDMLEKEEALLVFKNKNDSELNAKLVKRNPFVLNKILDKLVIIKEGVIKGKMIDRPYKSNSWQCEYCPYRLECWRLEPKARRWPVRYEQAQEGVKDASGSSLTATLEQSVTEVRQRKLGHPRK